LQTFNAGGFGNVNCNVILKWWCFESKHWGLNVMNHRFKKRLLPTVLHYSMVFFLQF